MGASSRHANGTQLLNCVYPQENGKIIPSFLIWWIGSLFDYAQYRRDLDLIKSLMPAAREQMERLFLWQELDGLLANPPGWNYIDDPSGGYANGGTPGQFGCSVNAPYNAIVLFGLHMLAQLEEWVEEPLLAKRWRQKGRTLMAVLDARLLDSVNG